MAYEASMLALVTREVFLKAAKFRECAQMLTTESLEQHLSANAVQNAG